MADDVFDVGPDGSVSDVPQMPSPPISATWGNAANVLRNVNDAASSVARTSDTLRGLLDPNAPAPAGVPPLLLLAGFAALVYFMAARKGD